MAKKKRSKKKWIIGAVAVIVVAVVGVVSFSGNGDEGKLVQADLAYIDNISEMVTASGRIQPLTKVDITAEVSAEIVEVYVREGDEVTRGDALLLLDTVQLKADMVQARFSLDETAARTEAARTQFELKRNDFERQKSLYERKLISESAYTEAEFAYENAQANYNAMLAQVKISRTILEKAEDNLAKTRIVAPMSGVITYLRADVGEIASAQTAYTQGRRLMTIADLSVFEVEVEVDETEVFKVQLGQAAEIRADAFVDTLFAGEVVEIGNSAQIIGEGTENYSTNFLVKVRLLENHPRIRPGMSATVDITTARADDALLIPYAAVVTREFSPDSLPGTIAEEPVAETVQSEGTLGVSVANAAEAPVAEASSAKRGREEKVALTGVFIITDGVARFAEVKTGIADDRNISVLSGIAAADTIVSGSYQTLRKLADGETVRIDETSMTKMKESD